MFALRPVGGYQRLAQRQAPDRIRRVNRWERRHLAGIGVPQAQAWRLKNWT